MMVPAVTADQYTPACTPTQIGTRKHTAAHAATTSRGAERATYHAVASAPRAANPRSTVRRSMPSARFTTPPPLDAARPRTWTRGLGSEAAPAPCRREIDARTRVVGRRAVPEPRGPGLGTRQSRPHPHRLDRGGVRVRRLHVAHASVTGGTGSLG